MCIKLKGEGKRREVKGGMGMRRRVSRHEWLKTDVIIVVKVN